MDIDETPENSVDTDRMGDDIPTVEYNKKSIEAMGRDELVTFLDGIDNRVEALRKEAMKLQEERDILLTRIDMLKNTDVLSNLKEADQEEINLHLQRINERLQTVDINVQTVRDHSQIDSLNVINHLIDEIIKFGDPIVKRKKCQEYLNACSSNDFQYTMSFSSIESTTVTFIDKKFEGHLLGCTLDDQKRIKKRLEALLNYMAQQIIMYD
ncbi:CLUMA_CG005706, isoform A [Clunio marinus]|uniref:CLUMA_CG005706, isoform A n=1 Tax=Clunio marinus TaxID=568069 RepID=A0A1J1HXA3_9DIPT|nr:CLUMA_CG005706, isoform A [Clunio marinus]